MAKPKSGMLGTGTAARAGQAIEKRKRKTKKRRADVMAQIRAGRKK